MSNVLFILYHRSLYVLFEISLVIVGIKPLTGVRSLDYRFR